MVTGTVPVVDTAPDGCISAHADCAAPRAPTAPRVAPQTLKCEYTMRAPSGEVVASATVLVASQITPSRPHVSFLYLCCQVSASAVETAMVAAYEKGLLAPHMISFDRVVLPPCDRGSSSAAQGSSARSAEKGF